jgi:hypothetical protein
MTAGYQSLDAASPRLSASPPLPQRLLILLGVSFIIVFALCVALAALIVDNRRVHSFPDDAIVSVNGWNQSLA